MRERGPGAPPYISACFCREKLVPENRHRAFRAMSRADMRPFHEASLKLGETDDGPPGLRPEYRHHYYGAFVHDPDGNRIEAVTHQLEDEE